MTSAAAAAMTTEAAASSLLTEKIDHYIAMKAKYPTDPLLIELKRELELLKSQLKKRHQPQQTTGCLLVWSSPKFVPGIGIQSPTHITPTP